LIVTSTGQPIKALNSARGCTKLSTFRDAGGGAQQGGAFAISLAQGRFAMNDEPSGLVWPLVLLFFTFFVLGLLILISPKLIDAERWVSILLFLGAVGIASALYVPRARSLILKFLTRESIPAQMTQIHNALIDGKEAKLEPVKKDIAALRDEVEAIGAFLNGDVHTKLEGISTELTDTGHVGKKLDIITNQLAAIEIKLPPKVG
jgi:hypothetical protein